MVVKLQDQNCNRGPRLTSSVTINWSCNTSFKEYPKVFDVKINTKIIADEVKLFLTHHTYKKTLAAAAHKILNVYMYNYLLLSVQIIPL